MNKLLFQFGLLAFFISLAVFSLQSDSLFDSILRAFIVFMALEVTLMFGIVIVTLSGKKHSQHEEQHTIAPNPAQTVNTTETVAH